MQKLIELGLAVMPVTAEIDAGITCRGCAGVVRITVGTRGLHGVHSTRDHGNQRSDQNPNEYRFKTHGPPLSLMDNAVLAAHLGKRRNRCIEVLAFVSGAQLYTDTGFAPRYYREVEPDNINSFFEQLGCHHL